jgi:hypothetical protein
MSDQKVSALLVDDHFSAADFSCRKSSRWQGIE